MFAKLFRKKPLNILIANQKQTFNSVQEFEFALNGRTHVTHDRVRRSLSLSDEELKKEAKGIKNVEKRFVKMLTHFLNTDTDVGAHILDLDPKLFSHDHDWRAIIAELNKQPNNMDDYKQVALVKYMQYLSTRQEVVKAIFRDRMARNEQLRVELEKPEDATEFSETIIFNVEDVNKALKEDYKPLVRIPKGEPVVIPLVRNTPVPIMLSTHHFTLQCEEGMVLQDESGERFQLNPGRNFIGRHSQAQVTVSGDYRDISRKHLIIEYVPPCQTCLTDISSHGTSVPPEYLERTSDQQGDSD